MRTRADVFAIVTITFLFVVQTLAFNLHDLTGGSQGASLPIAPFSAANFELPFYYVLAALLIFTMGLTFATMGSKLGLSLVSIRSDEDKARGVGVRTMGVKVLAFSVSVGITAMVGAVWAYYQSFIYPQFAVDPLITIAIVLMTFLGGRGTLWGPVLGAVILESGQQLLTYQLGAVQLYLIVYALLFLVIILLLPRGILPTIEDRLRMRRRRRRADAAAALPGTRRPRTRQTPPPCSGEVRHDRPAVGTRGHQDLRRGARCGRCLVERPGGTITALIGPTGRARRPCSTSSPATCRRTADG